jgi:exodeoxyribonuclease VII large subunit
MKVILHGSVAVYQRDGSYQLYVNSMEPDGIGALYLAYEQLKEKLFGEGLFDDVYKKDIPRFPEKIGVITSPTGAAVRDIINVTGRRYPLAKIYLYPSLVQGDGAVENLICALDYFEKTKLVDVIIIGRGGGSIEDLWAFNSEQLARKIFSISIPVISAVGHETDFTICDFVSDLRAPTPSAAAELAVPDIRELIMRVDGMSERLSVALLHLIERKREKLDIISSSAFLKSPLDIISNKRDLLLEKQDEILSNIKEIIEQKRIDLILKTEKINALNPLSVMARGYTVAEKDGVIIKKAKDLALGDVLCVKFSDGTVDANVTKITKKKGAQ